MTTDDPQQIPEPSQGQSPSPKKEFPLDRVDLDWAFNPLADDIHLLESKGASINGLWMEFDADDTTKLFTSPAATVHHVMKLKPRAMQLFLWLLYKLEYKSDIVEITHKRVKKTCKMANNTFRKAIQDLIDARIIARLTDHNRSTPETKERDYWRFWINPHVMFKGSRYQYYRDNAVLVPEGQRPYLSPEERSTRFPPKG